MSLPLFAVGLAVATAAVLKPKRSSVGAVTLRDPNAVHASLQGQYIPAGNYVLTPAGAHCPSGYNPTARITSLDGRTYILCMRERYSYVGPTYGSIPGVYR